MAGGAVFLPNREKGSCAQTKNAVVFGTGGQRMWLLDFMAGLWQRGGEHMFRSYECCADFHEEEYK